MAAIKNHKKTKPGPERDKKWNRIKKLRVAIQKFADNHYSGDYQAAMGRLRTLNKSHKNRNT